MLACRTLDCGGKGDAAPRVTTRETAWCSGLTSRREWGAARLGRARLRGRQGTGAQSSRNELLLTSCFYIYEAGNYANITEKETVESWARVVARGRLCCLLGALNTQRHSRCRPQRARIS